MSEHDQSFASEQEWIKKGRSWLTRRGPNVKATCYDAKGRLVTCGGDFARATKDNAFPVRWLWPDQVAELAALHLASEPTSAQNEIEALRKQVAELEGFKEAAIQLANAETDYRLKHDLHGSGDLRTGRAWDHMRRCAQSVRNTALSLENTP